jgi:hypothetical protein
MVRWLQQQGLDAHSLRTAWGSETEESAEPDPS